MEINNHQRGASLLEILLVMSIIATILAAAINQYLNYQRTEKIAILEQSVGQLMLGLNQYYFSNCHNSAVTQVSLQELEQQGFINNGKLNNPYGDLAVRIINVGSATTPFYQLQVSADLSKIDSQTKREYIAKQVAAVVNADPTGMTELTWTRMPTQSMDDLNSKMWVMDQAPGQPNVPLRGLTAVRQGTNSGLWMMNSCGQYFSSAEQTQSFGVCPN